MCVGREGEGVCVVCVWGVCGCVRGVCECGNGRDRVGVCVWGGCVGVCVYRGEEKGGGDRREEQGEGKREKSEWNMRMCKRLLA